jgi:hypothetical protein
VNEQAEQWEFYFCAIEGRPASISLDLSLAERAPLADLPHLLCVRVQLNAPRPDGLSDGAEAPALYALEDALGRTAAELLGARQVGRITTSGHRELVYYARSLDRLQEALDRGLSEFSAYRISFHTAEEPEWTMFRQVLMPGEAEWHWIMDRRVVDQLQQAGDDSAAPRPVDHYAFFPDRAAADRFTAELAGEGFDASIRRDDDGRFVVHALREDPVELPHIHPLVKRLRDRAAALGGQYDGWGAPVVAQGQGSPRPGSSS